MSAKHNHGIASPYAAIYLLFEKDGKVPLLLRQNTGWMDGYYGMPSGRVEKEETMTQAAIRECQEEVGVKLKPEQLSHRLTAHVKGNDGTEWVAIGFVVDTWEGELQNSEPHVHASLDWFKPSDLPDNIAPSHRHVLEQMLEGSASYTEHGWVN